MATCPKCGVELGLKTSFAFANFWTMGGVPPYGRWPLLEYPCYRCNTILTYRYELAGLFAVLALLPFIAQQALTLLDPGQMNYAIWALECLAYWAALAALFSYNARPRIANPPIEGG